MKIRFKKLDDKAVMPSRSSDGAAGWDLFCVGGCPCVVNQPTVFGTGLAVEIPKGYAMLILSRSGHGFKHSTRLSNCVGLIDSDYRGEIKVRMVRDADIPEFLMVYPGDRIAQAIILPIPEIEWEEGELGETRRGEGGFGSTGR